MTLTDMHPVATFSDEPQALFEEAHQRRRKVRRSTAAAIVLVLLAGGISYGVGSGSGGPPRHSTVSHRAPELSASGISATSNASRACFSAASNPDPALAIPKPQRLDKVVTIDLGTPGPDTLRPPLPAQHSAVSRSTLQAMWASLPFAKQRSATYQMMLARFTARLPAVQQADGSFVPTFDNQLVWVVVAIHVANDNADVSAPPVFGSRLYHPKPSCSYDVGVATWDALSGRELMSQGGGGRVIPSPERHTKNH